MTDPCSSCKARTACFSFFFLTCVVCLYAYVYVCWCVDMCGSALYGGQKLTWGVFHDHCPLYLLNHGLLLNPGLANGASLATQLISEVPVSASWVLGVHGCWESQNSVLTSPYSVEPLPSFLDRDMLTTSVRILRNDKLFSLMKQTSGCCE